jgi:hypothetical protein
MLSPATRAGKKRAITLFEYVIAIGVAALVVIALVPLSIYTATSLASLANWADMNTSSVTAVDQLTTDIRRAVRVTSFLTNSVELRFADGTSVQYEYAPTAGTLVRKRQAQENVLLTGCKTLNFSIFQRTPIPGTYDQYPAATNTETKVIAINWTSQRKLIGARANQDQLHSAKVVMRCR